VKPDTAVGQVARTVVGTVIGVVAEAMPGTLAVVAQVAVLAQAVPCPLRSHHKSAHYLRASFRTSYIFFHS